jgi:nucleoside-diphosphate-sugar epimerase
MLDGRTRIPLAGEGESVFHTSATVNIAALIRSAADTGANHLLNAGDPTAPTLRAIGEIIAAQIGWTGEFIGVPLDSPIGQTPFSTPSPIIVSMAAAESIGYLPAGNYAEIIVPYVEWMRAHAADWQAAFPMFGKYPSDPFDYAAEDAMIG